MLIVLAVVMAIVLSIVGLVAFFIRRWLRCLSCVGQFAKWHPRGTQALPVPFFVESVRRQSAKGWYMRGNDRVYDVVSCGRLSRGIPYDFLSDVRRGDRVVVLSGGRYGKEDRVTGRGGGKVLLKSGTVVHHWEIRRL